VLRREAPPTCVLSGRREDSGLLPPVLQGATAGPLVVPQAFDQVVTLGEDRDEGEVHPT